MPRSRIAHHGDFALRNDVAVIDLLIHVMNGYACPLLVSCKCLFPCFQAREFRQERGMNVHDSARESGQHLFLQDAHETSQNDNLHFRILQHRGQLRFHLRLKPCPKLPRRQVGVRHSELTRDLQNRRIEHIGNYNGDPCS